MITFTPQDYVIEPANVQLLRCVQSISLANKPRRIIPNGAEADAVINNEYFRGYNLADNFALKNTSVNPMRNGINLVGDIVLEAGYNVAFAVLDNSINISAVAGGGASVSGGQPAEVPVTKEEEQVLQNGDYLSGGPKCFQLVAQINGLAGDSISVSGGDGVSVTGTQGVLTITMQSAAQADKCDVRTC